MWSENHAAHLWAQLQWVEIITVERLEIWNAYKEALLPLDKVGILQTGSVTPLGRDNARIFWVKIC